ncbi:hypothetical protein L596_030041 [Steinernema carpocapsae]|uniref:Uncharacterized protein n=1 Tax=Steinernema carpocapsae TaxID=34508 RepID=A0A4U5LRJ0_STECR|nr:hypothetical protein L596_030041 [Steinernema carpocapsae]
MQKPQTFVQNGGTHTQLRPQFRRQGSSIGAGHVHNMAVIVAPTKVDYSVTKGGIRIWAVLFVFVFLCSSLYTVFSEGELSHEDYRDVEEDDDKEEVSSYEAPSTYSQPHVPDPSLPAETADDEELLDDRDALETTLFSNLKRKIERKMKELQGKDEPRDVPSRKTAREARRKTRRRARRPVVVQEEESEEDEKEEEEDVDEEDEDKEDEKESEEVQESEEEAAQDIREEDEDEDEDEDDEDEDNEEGEEEENENESEKPRPDEPRKTASKKEDNKNDQDEEIAIAASKPKRRKKERILTEVKQAPCMRKNCPDYSSTPRKNLLKSKKKSRTNPKIQLRKQEVPSGKKQKEDIEEEVQEVVVRKPLASGRAAYRRASTTNREDYKYREKLDDADFHIEKVGRRGSHKRYRMV